MANDVRIPDADFIAPENIDATAEIPIARPNENLESVNPLTFKVFRVSNGAFPTVDASNLAYYQSCIAIDETGKAYLVRTRYRHATDPVGSFNVFSHSDFFGVVDNRVDFHVYEGITNGQYVYDISYHSFYRYHHAAPAGEWWQYRLPQQALEAMGETDVVWDGERNSAEDALIYLVENFNNTHSYFAFFDGQIQKLDNSTYVAGTERTAYYAWEQIGGDFQRTITDLLGEVPAHRQLRFSNFDGVGSGDTQSDSFPTGEVERIETYLTADNTSVGLVITATIDRQVTFTSGDARLRILAGSDVVANSGWQSITGLDSVNQRITATGQLVSTGSNENWTIDFQTRLVVPNGAEVNVTNINLDIFSEYTDPNLLAQSLVGATGLSAADRVAIATNLGVIDEDEIISGDDVTGTGSQIILTTTPAVTTFANGDEFVFIAPFHYSGPLTARISNNPNIFVVSRPDQTPIQTGDIHLGDLVVLVFDSINNRFTARNMNRGQTQNAAQTSVAASGFDGNLETTDDTVQKVAQKVDDLDLTATTSSRTRIEDDVTAAASTVKALTLDEPLESGYDLEVIFNDANGAHAYLTFSCDALLDLTAQTSTPTTTADALSEKMQRMNATTLINNAQATCYLWRGNSNSQIFIAVTQDGALDFEIYKVSRGGTRGLTGNPGSSTRRIYTRSANILTDIPTGGSWDGTKYVPPANYFLNPPDFFVFERTPDLDLDIGDGGWGGVFELGTNIHFIDNVNKRTRAYSTTDFSRQSASDINLDNNGVWVGGAAFNGGAYLMDASAGRHGRFFNADGSRDAAQDIVLGGSAQWHGVVAFGGHIYFISRESNSAVAFDTSRVRQTGEDISLPNRDWAGAFTVEDHVVFIDSTTHMAHFYDFDGNAQTDLDRPLGSGAVGVVQFNGGVTIGDRVYLAENTNDKGVVFRHHTFEDTDTRTFAVLAELGSDQSTIVYNAPYQYRPVATSDIVDALVEATSISDSSQTTIRANLGITNTGGTGSEWTVGAAFPTSPADNDIHLFSADATGLTSYFDADGTTTRTTAVIGDVAQWDNTNSRWEFQGNIRGGAGEDGEDGTDGTGTQGVRGSIWTVGVAFPTSPNTNDLFLFNLPATSLTNFQNSDGNSITSAVVGDVAQWNGTVWLYVDNIKGNDGNNGTDGVRGSIWTVGSSFPSSPNTNDLFLFNLPATGLTNYQNSDDVAITSAQIGDVAQWDGSLWRFVDNIKGSDGNAGTRGTLWTTGIAFPSSLINGDLFLFSADVASGLTWVDGDGNARTDADQGDIAQWNHAQGRWEFRLNIQGTGGTGTSVARIFIDAVSDIPSSPNVGDVLKISTSITTGLPTGFVDEDGTALTSVLAGEEYERTSTNWQRSYVVPTGDGKIVYKELFEHPDFNRTDWGQGDFADSVTLTSAPTAGKQMRVTISNANRILFQEIIDNDSYLAGNPKTGTDQTYGNSQAFNWNIPAPNNASGGSSGETILSIVRGNATGTVMRFSAVHNTFDNIKVKVEEITYPGGIVSGAGEVDVVDELVDATSITDANQKTIRANIGIGQTFLPQGLVSQSGNNLTITPDNAPTTLTDGLTYAFVMPTTNTGAVDLTISSGSVQLVEDLLNSDGTQLAADDLPGGELVIVRRISSSWRVTAISGTSMLSFMPSGGPFFQESMVGGTSTEITLEPDPAVTDYADIDGNCYAFVGEEHYFEGVTVEISDLASKSVVRPDGNPLHAGDLRRGHLIIFKWDNTNDRWIWINGVWDTPVRQTLFIADFNPSTASITSRRFETDNIQEFLSEANSYGNLTLSYTIEKSAAVTGTMRVQFMDGTSTVLLTRDTTLDGTDDDQTETITKRIPSFSEHLGIQVSFMNVTPGGVTITMSDIELVFYASYLEANDIFDSMGNAASIDLADKGVIRNLLDVDTVSPFEAGVATSVGRLRRYNGSNYLAIEQDDGNNETPDINDRFNLIQEIPYSDEGIRTTQVHRDNVDVATDNVLVATGYTLPTTDDAEYLLFNCGSAVANERENLQWIWVRTERIRGLTAAAAGDTASGSNSVALQNVVNDNTDVFLARTSANELLISTNNGPQDLIPLTIRRVHTNFGTTAVGSANVNVNTANSLLATGITHPAASEAEYLLIELGVPSTGSSENAKSYWVRLSDLLNLNASVPNDSANALNTLLITDVSGTSDIRIGRRTTGEILATSSNGAVDILPLRVRRVHTTVFEIVGSTATITAVTPDSFVATGLTIPDADMFDYTIIKTNDNFGEHIWVRTSDLLALPPTTAGTAVNNTNSGGIWNAMGGTILYLGRTAANELLVATSVTSTLTNFSIISSNRGSRLQKVDADLGNLEAARLTEFLELITGDDRLDYSALKNAISTAELPIGFGWARGSNPLITGGTTSPPSISDPGTVTNLTYPTTGDDAGYLLLNANDTNMTQVNGGIGFNAEIPYFAGVYATWRASTSQSDMRPRWAMIVYIGGAELPIGNHNQEFAKGSLSVTTYYHRNSGIGEIVIRYPTSTGFVDEIGNTDLEWIPTSAIPLTDIELFLRLENQRLRVIVRYAGIHQQIHDHDVSDWDRGGTFNGFLGFQVQTQFQAQEFLVGSIGGLLSHTGMGV